MSSLTVIFTNVNVFCRKNIAKLNKELQTKTLLQLAETDRLRHTEHQLHISESKVEKLNSDNIKLRLKIDDLRIKMQSRKYHKTSNSLLTVILHCTRLQTYAPKSLTCPFFILLLFRILFLIIDKSDVACCSKRFAAI